MKVKPINKRASGQAFEVILKPPSPTSEGGYSITSPPKKRDVSLEDIQKKLEAAEDRRKVSETSRSSGFILVISVLLRIKAQIRANAFWTMVVHWLYRFKLVRTGCHNWFFVKTCSAKLWLSLKVDIYWLGFREMSSQYLIVTVCYHSFWYIMYDIH